VSPTVTDWDPVVLKLSVSSAVAPERFRLTTESVTGALSIVPVRVASGGLATVAVVVPVGVVPVTRVVAGFAVTVIVFVVLAPPHPATATATRPTTTNPTTRTARA
jgi:hypothetical protein